MIQAFIHYSLHFLLPIGIARYWDKGRWIKVTAILWATMLVDLDHLLADPIFDPGRCSIGFHPLHSYPAIAVYVAFLYPKKTRLIALGLVLHMMTDGLDCWLGKIL